MKTVITPEDERLIPFGWAPGWYLQPCRTCGEPHIAAKYARRCRPCAELKAAEPPTGPLMHGDGI